ncbi:MAG TPA: phosphopentomutase [Malonomonas sp.]
MFRRVILIVLDGVGVGALSDAADYGDATAATLPHVATAVGGLSLPNLQHLGLGRIAAIDGVSPAASPLGCWGRMAERSPGKDSVTGHWELAGVVLRHPFATFPDGFPAEIIEAFTAATGLQPLGNIAASGTDILRLLGEQHLQTGRPIVYTSSDSVFQIAAHESVIPPEDLYVICRQAKAVLQSHNVCRVIARPFSGTSAENFRRTAQRRDFSQSPPEKILLERLSESGLPVYGVGKIKDLYAGRGLTGSVSSKHNSDGMVKTLAALEEINAGLIMTNLIDFDMLYGHRRDAEGFAAALEAFDSWLPQLYACMRSDDLLLISADHGCDPTMPGTDHTREYVPLLAWSPSLATGMELGLRSCFADVAATIAENFSLSCENGKSFLSQLQVAST